MVFTVQLIPIGGFRYVFGASIIALGKDALYKLLYNYYGNPFPPRCFLLAPAHEHFMFFFIRILISVLFFISLAAAVIEISYALSRPPGFNGHLVRKAELFH